MMIAYRDGMLASPPRYWGLCFTAEEPGVVVSMAKAGSPPAVTLETSRDGVRWEPFDPDAKELIPITLAKVGDCVYFRAGPAGNAAMASNNSAYRRFTLSGRCAASGNAMSLISATDPGTGFASRSPYAFYRLFSGCTALTAAPALPATTLVDYCYRSMFRGCTALTAAPALPTTALTMLEIYCYRDMFTGCTSLREVEVAFSTWIPGATTGWLSGVPSTGTFRCPSALGTNATILRGESNCPEGWTVVNTD